ncbi:MAG: phosphate acyltransferase PlsX [Gemmatimonadota bacterium]|jgi:glycerol-3-phosphate acyltransferase PlsX|nr:phosphate--acyl-ACP acyltransferase [Gemmatimonadota bacterium]MDP6462144.1 phosphate acyltransferase PlsX [Gemmatimonadota bacterium]MDP6529317.1 phosphate acyltransferase PlsX [Gemmatimonadota bacterium]MDP6802202.1 phosphate acyltransferase PlsX [Gemmatimonadota bacterium]MDP7031532.1 phosphate acyltransferase PlsX [Gemmatimonadota bacterium]
MRIAIDAMGGDGAPAVEVRGAIEAVAQDETNTRVVLVGDEAVLREELSRQGAEGTPEITIEHAPEQIEMGEDPARQVRRKRDASIVVATRLLKEGAVDGLVSAGNTGAVVASSLFLLGRLEGVRRPAIATFVPTNTGGAIILDVGATSDCTPQHLLQFGVMGAIYARRVLGRAEAKVGLLNIGEESSKGNSLVRGTYPLLQESSLNFIGNVEGRDIFQGGADVVVTDGFTGNIVLKFSESVIHLVTSLIREEVGDDLRRRFGAVLMRPVFRSLSQQLDYAEYGGAPLLGVNGAVIIAHGSSSPKAIRNAVLVAARFAREGINDHIRNELQGQCLGNA